MHCRIFRKTAASLEKLRMWLMPAVAAPMLLTLTTGIHGQRSGGDAPCQPIQSAFLGFEDGFEDGRSCTAKPQNRGNRRKTNRRSRPYNNHGLRPESMIEGHVSCYQLLQPRDVSMSTCNRYPQFLLACIFSMACVAPGFTQAQNKTPAGSAAPTAKTKSDAQPVEKSPLADLWL